MSATPLQVLRLQQAQRQRWRNDGGWTREIHREGPADDWHWRLSIAEVEADGPFSTFPGVEREIVLLAGNGMCLDFAGGRTVELVPEAPALRFDGEAAVHCRLIDGPTTDFNLMFARRHVQAECWRRPLVGGGLLNAAADEAWVVHLLAGSLQFPDAAGEPLAAGDTAILRGGAEGQRQRIEGSGSGQFIRIRPQP